MSSGAGGSGGGGGRGSSKSSGGGGSRGRSRPSRSGRNGNNRETRTPAATATSTAPDVVTNVPRTSTPPQPTQAAGAGAAAAGGAKRDNGLIPGSGLLALQALAAAQTKAAASGANGSEQTSSGNATGTGAIPAAVAKAAEKAVAASAPAPVAQPSSRGAASGTGKGGGGGGGGGRNAARIGNGSSASTRSESGKSNAPGGTPRGSGKSGKGHGSSSSAVHAGGGGASKEKDVVGGKGRGGISTGGRGGFAAAAAAAAKGGGGGGGGGLSSTSRGKAGVDGTTGRGSARGSGGGNARKSTGKESIGNKPSEADERKKADEAKSQLAAQQEQRKKAEEERLRKAEEDRKAAEQQRARREAEEKQRQRKAEADARRRELEEKKAAEAKKKTEERRRREDDKKRKEEERKQKEEAKARREAERVRLEAERVINEEKRAIEEEKRQREAEQERVRREFEAQLEAVSQLELLQKEDRARRELRAKHTPEALKSSREAHEANKSKLKSDLKKTTAFTKKVKALSEDQRSSLSKEVEGLNLSRYVSEIVDAVVENKLKNADVPAAVHLCCLMHQRYAEFADDLISKLAAPFLSSTAEEERDDKENLRRKRSNLRLLTELHSSGVFDGSRLIVRIVRSLCGLEGKDTKRARPAPAFGDARRREQQTVTAAPAPLRDNDVILLAGFVRAAGEEMVGVLQRKTVNMLKIAGEMGRLEREPIVDADIKGRLRILIDGAFDALCSHLERGHEQMGRLEKRMERDKLTNGSLTEEKEKNLDESRKAYEALLANVTSLAASLNREMPQLPEEEEEEEAGGISLWEGGVGGDGTAYSGPFEESERSFYEDLPDLLNTVPPNLLGLTEEEAEQLREEERSKQKGSATAAVDEDESTGTGDDVLVGELEGLSVSGAGEDDREGSDKEEEEGKDGAGADGEDGEEGGEYMSRNAQLIIMLEDELPNCHNQERVDEFAKKFCYVNSKGARKKLVAALFNVPRQALDLLPMYARLVAILDKAMKSIAPALLEELRTHFRYFLRKKAPGQIDHRIKNVRFIGELVKFRVAPPVVAFQCLKSCLDDFGSLAVQTMASLLETCGRFLFRQTLTHQRMRKFLAVMMKLKKAKNLDPRLEALIDNAFYACCPPERQERVAKVRTAPQLYVRHLMMEKLKDDADVVEAVIKQLRKLPWQDPEEKIESEVLRASLRLCRSRYPCIHLAADVLSGLARYQDRVAVRAVDAVLEAMQRGIELPGGSREFQRLVGYARLLAELYNYAIVGSPTIFETLNLLLNSGHEVPPEMKQPRADRHDPNKAIAPPAAAVCARFDPRVRSPSDPPGDCLRIRLVVAILEGCGTYFVRGAGLVKLSSFLSVFQRYLFCKERLPAGTEFAVLDLMDDLETAARAAREKERAKAKKAQEEGKGKSSRGRGRRGKEEAEEDLDNGPILPRHRTWEDAQAAVEQADRVWDEESRKRMAKITELQARDEKEAGDTGGEGGTDGEEDDDHEDEEEDDDDDDGRRGPGSAGEEEGASERGRGDGEGSEKDMSEEETGGDVEGGDAVVIPPRGVVERTEEDGEAEDEFEALLSKTMLESVEKTKIARATTQVMGHMAVPMVLKSTTVRGARHDAPLTGGSGVSFKLLKRGNKGKMEAQEVVVPAATSLAAQVSRNEEANREESSIIKARVLAYEANIEAAVLAQDMGAVPLPEDYTQFIPQVHNAPLHPEGNKGGVKGAGSGRGRGGGRDLLAQAGRGGGVGRIGSSGGGGGARKR